MRTASDQWYFAQEAECSEFVCGLRNTDGALVGFGISRVIDGHLVDLQMCLTPAQTELTTQMLEVRLCF